LDFGNRIKRAESRGLEGNRPFGEEARDTAGRLSEAQVEMTTDAGPNCHGDRLEKTLRGAIWRSERDSNSRYEIEGQGSPLYSHTKYTHLPRGAYGESLVGLNADGYRRMTDHLAAKKIWTAGGNAKFGQTGIRTPIDWIQLGSRAGILGFCSS
jgi:hypothetical protein